MCSTDIMKQEKVVNRMSCIHMALDYKHRKLLVTETKELNNSYRESIGMSPYETLYERSCRTPL